MLNNKCYLCNSRNFAPVYYLKNRVIFRCPNDDLYFSIDQKEGKFTYDDNYYQESPYDQNNSLIKIYFQDKLNRISKLIKDNNSNILDVGCGWGNFLEVVKNNNLSYLGIDLSEEAVKICKRKNLNCQKIDLIKLGSKKNLPKFSIISFFQVIEHIKNPLQYLKSAKKLLKKNGVMLITTPNNNSPLRSIFGSHWSVYQTPSHYFFYSKKTLGLLLKTAGFKNFSIKIDKFRFFSLEYIVNRIFNKKISLPKMLNFPIPTDPWGDLEVIIQNK